MRLTVTISCYEQRYPASTVGIDTFCRKSHYSWLEHYTTWARRRPNTPRNLSLRTQVGRPSGRQDSNLRPLVPQTSPYFPPRAEFDLEWFCGELVGMTTRARVMESAGIVEKYLSALRQRPSPIPSSLRPFPVGITA